MRLYRIDSLLTNRCLKNLTFSTDFLSKTDFWVMHETEKLIRDSVLYSTLRIPFAILENQLEDEIRKII